MATHKARPKPGPAVSGPKGKNTMGHGKAEAKVKGPEKGGIKNFGGIKRSNKG